MLAYSVLTEIWEVHLRNQWLFLAANVVLFAAGFYKGWIERDKQKQKRAKSKRPYVSFEKRWRCAQRQKWKCNVCKRILPVEAELDHVVPLFLNGSNDVNNLQLLCPNCHAKKTFAERQYICDSGY